MCLTLCNPIDFSLPAFLVLGIFQAGILEWVAISYSRYVRFVCVCVCVHIYIYIHVSVQFSCSVTQSCPTLCNPMDCSTPGFPAAAAATAKLLQSCPTLCDPIDGSPPGSAVPGILQARTLEWVAIAFSIVRK